MIDQPSAQEPAARQVLALADRGRIDEVVAQSAAQGNAGRPLDALRAAAASEAFKASGDLAGLCGALVRAGGDHAQAFSALEQAESIARDLGGDTRRALVLRHIGVCCSTVSRHQQAWSGLGVALDLHAAGGPAAEALTSRLSLYNARNRQAHALPPEHVERHAALAEPLRLWPALAADGQRASAAWRPTWPSTTTCWANATRRWASRPRQGRPLPTPWPRCRRMARWTNGSTPARA